MSRSGWDDYFFKMAELVASKSKDRSTKVGCVLVGPDNEVLATGFNGYPRGVTDDIDGAHDRATRLMFTCHAEANAVVSAARTGTATKGSRAYVTHWPCADCSKLLIQAGVSEVVAPVPDTALYERWKESFDAGLKMFAEAKVMAREFVAEEC